MIHDFPYTNFHDLNADWIVERIGNVDHAVTESAASAEAAAASEQAAASSAEQAAASEESAQNNAELIQSAADNLVLLNARIENLVSAQTGTKVTTVRSTNISPVDGVASTTFNLPEGYAILEALTKPHGTAVWHTGCGINEANNVITLTLETTSDTDFMLIYSSTEAVPNAEVVDIRTGYNGIIYTSAGDAVREQIRDLNTEFNSVIMTGRNLLNPDDIETGYVLKANGTISNVATGYTSDFINVKPSVTYAKKYVFGSSTISNVVFYDATHTYISSSTGSSHTFETPSNCAYIRICGYTADAPGEMLAEGTSYTYEPYKLILKPAASSGSMAYFACDGNVIYDTENKQIRLITNSATAKVNLYIPSVGLKNFTNPISVTGDGSYLYYNLTSNAFHLSNNASESDDNYNIGIATATKQTDLKAPKNQFAIGSKEPVLNIDTAENKITVTTSSAYVWYFGSYFSLPNETYELTINSSGANCIYFNLLSRRFEANTTFSNYARPELIPIGYINSGNIFMSVPYTVRAIDNKLFGKRIITYGDSLTWYDGQAFTWGDHQGETCYGYQSYLRGYLGATVVNKGQSGTSTPQIMNAILADSTTINTADYVMIMPSIMNDDRLNVSPGTVLPIGSTFNTQTTAGSLQNAIEYIYSVKQNARIIIMVEPMGFTYVNGNPKLCNELLAVAIRNVAALYGLPCIDLWNVSGINALTRNTYYADPTFESGNVNYMYHPNNEGWKVLSRIICDEMKKY